MKKTIVLVVFICVLWILFSLVAYGEQNKIETLEEKIEFYAEMLTTLRKNTELEKNTEPNRGSHRVVAITTQEDEVKLLARLIQSEAGGESYEGKLAVGTVVMNRADKSNSGWFSDNKYTISGVIYKRGQFDGVGTHLWNGAISEDSLRAAQSVIDGYRSFEKEIVFFHNPAISTNTAHVNSVEVLYEIGGHVFGK